MSNILNAAKEKFNSLKRKPLMKTVLISVLALLLIASVTVAWYINNLEMWGVEFNTGNIDFNAYVYDANGTRVVGPVSSNNENESKYMNAPLISIKNAQVGTTGTAYIVIESTGSLAIQYRIAFDIAGRNENSTAYLGGYKYNISKVTDDVDFNDGELDVTGCSAPEKIDNEMITIDRNAVNGAIEKQNGYDVYRMDYTLAEKNEEYTGGGINIFFNIFATQIDGDFEDTAERGYTYYCSTKEDIDRAAVEAYPGDIIKLSSNIVYYGDLVFNKPINLETNDFTLTINGNLMYDYVLGNSLKLDAGGLGRIIVQCANNGVGGNFQIKAPISDVTLVGSNEFNGDIVVEKNMTIDATNSFGSAGVSFNEVKIVNLNNSLKSIQLESNTRTTVSFGTTIGLFQSVAKANNIEIVNNGIIGEINLSNMSLLPQTNSPQIYILNNKDINNPIVLPDWSEKFQVDGSGVCTGNTKIIQSFSGGRTEVIGECDFDNNDVEVEKKDFLVEQIEEGDDSRLKIYYQDIDGQTTTIRSILENYFNNEATTGSAVNEVLQLEIISVGDKVVTSNDISFMNSNSMLLLKHLDMQRANFADNKLYSNAFSGVSKYESLVLPQNLVEIGSNAFSSSKIENIITIPSGVTVFGANWFGNGKYVRFAASVPPTTAVAGLTNITIIFVDEAYISSYKSAFSNHNTRIYPASVMDEAKGHFVRNIGKDEWEITYYIGGEDAVIGDNITIDGVRLKITSIYDNAYRHKFTGTKVKFADTVENIGAYNFYNKSSITEVDLNNLKYIGNNAFEGNSSLKQVVFGNYLETIGSNAFYNCVNLSQEVILPATMQSIGGYAFRNTKITALNTGGTTVIGNLAFANCTDLIYAELPNVQTTNERLFEYDSSLVSVKISSLTKSNGARLFGNCVSLREVYMAAKEDAMNLGSHVYEGCDLSKLKLYVPEEYIEFYRSKCPGGISSGSIYPQGEKIGEVSVNGFNIGAYIIGENGDGTYKLITSNLEYSDNLVIPEEFDGKVITHIYDNAFRNQSFTNVTLKLGDNIVSIGSNAFYQQEGLIKVEFGDSLKTIGGSAFAYCSNLVQDVVLPDSMERISGSAFRNSGISGINTGGTTSVDGRAFANCTSLAYAKLPEVTVIAESGTNELFTSCTSLVSVEMPKVTKVSGEGLFRYCSSLLELYLGSDDENVTLGRYVFDRFDSSRVKLFVPEDLLSFYQGKNFINAIQVYPMGEKLGDKTVNGFVVGDYIVMENDSGYTLVTSNLTFEGDVALPETYKNKPINKIYTNAFRNQTFTDVNLTLGSGVNTIGSAAFYGRSGLKTVIMDSVTTINSDAFYSSGIQVLNGPNVTSIGNNAFRKCTDLETVNLPKLETITSTSVFAECTSLKSVYFENVRALDSSTFYLDKLIEKITINKIIDSNGSNMPATMAIDSQAPCIIYVPYRSLSAYTSVWSGKQVMSFDISATADGHTYILADNNGRYALIDFVPGHTITALEIPNTVFDSQIGDISIYSIRAGAFSAVAKSLQTVTLPSSVALIESNALSELSVLENIYVDANNMYFTSVNGVLCSKDSRLLVKYPAGRSGQFDMTDAAYSSTIGIAANAFANATNLTQITFPESLMVIDSTAFVNCEQLNTVVFTGNTPPVLMGSGIFDTSVRGFKMIIPTDDSNVVAAYLCAYNFVEYEPYIALN